jgi:hypothetical protein
VNSDEFIMNRYSSLFLLEHEGVRKWGDGGEEATGGVVKDVKGSY